ncbi:hypothetical protein AB1N83_014469 [Pleurotus pulmonarius]
MPYIFGLSAPSESALIDLRDQYVHWLQSPQGEAIRLADVVYTTIAHRPLQSHRLSLSASTKPELVEKLRSAKVVRTSTDAARVAFVFSGQGRYEAAYEWCCLTISGFAFAECTILKEMPAGRSNSERWSMLKRVLDGCIMSVLSHPASRLTPSLFLS